MRICQMLNQVIQRLIIEPRTRKHVKESFARKYKKQLLDAGLDSLKTAYKKVVHKAGEIIENRIAEPASKSNDNKQEPVEEIIIPPEEKR